ncbi:hypothetical protein ACFE04_024967 [Oxalis oulophora]
MSSFSGGPSNEMDENSRSGNTTSGFRLHIGGRLSFENPWSYIGGSMIADWDLVPGELTMTTLHHTIEIMGYEGSVLSVHYKRPGLNMGVGLTLIENDDVQNCVDAWKEEGQIDIYVEHTVVDGDGSNTYAAEHVHSKRNSYNGNESDGNSGAEDNNGEESDDDEGWLDDVEYASENENDELNEYLVKARGYVDEAATFGKIKRNATGEIMVDDDSDGDYSVGNSYEDDPDLNWSLVDDEEDELRRELAELENEEVEVEAPKWGLTVEDHVSHWFKKDLYHDLYTTYIPNPMRIGRDLWPQSDLSPLAAPPPRILKGRPGHKRKPEAGEGFTTVAAGSPTVRRKKVGKGPNASKKGKNARKGPIQTKKGTSSESTHPSSAAVHSQSTFTETSGGSPLLGARMLKSLQVEMTLDEYVQQSPSKRRMVKGLSTTQ